MGDNDHQTTLLNAAALGELTAYERLANLSYEQIDQVLQDHYS